MDSFGRPPDPAPLKPEARSTSDGDRAKDLERILEGYRALDETSKGAYREFLQQAARCTRCRRDENIPETKQPIPLMCGTAGLGRADRESFVRAHDLLGAYRRADGTVRFDPGKAGRESLETFLDEQRLDGLAMGHCGWGDFTARARGSQLGEGVDVLILGADWFPLTQCSNFLFERQAEWDATLMYFFKQLKIGKDQVAGFLRDHRAYMGNALLCYRTGWDTKGSSNLSSRSFVHCRGHLARHIGALTPRIVITFGQQASRSVCALLCGESARDRTAIERLREQTSLKQVMQEFFAAGERAGIAARFGEKSLIFLPLYHPSYGGRYRYDGDYETLEQLLGR